MLFFVGNPFVSVVVWILHCFNHQPNVRSVHSDGSVQKIQCGNGLAGWNVLRFGSERVGNCFLIRFRRNDINDSDDFVLQLCKQKRGGGAGDGNEREREQHEKPWLRLACIVHRSRIFFQFSWKNVIARVKQEKYGKPHTYVLGRYAIGIRRIPNC